jgi:uncharacterized protein Yka (UPF0111/DUF47 family)
VAEQTPFDDCVALIKEHQRALDVLRKVAATHIDRFENVQKFAEAITASVQGIQANIGNLVNAVEDLANLTGRIEKRVTDLEQQEASRKRFN